MLSEVDLLLFDPKTRPPVTNEKANMIERGATDEEGLILELKDNTDGPEIITAKQLERYAEIIGETEFRKKVAAKVISKHYAAKYHKQSERIKWEGRKFQVWIMRRKGYWIEAGSCEIRHALEGVNTWLDELSSDLSAKASAADFEDVSEGSS